MSGQSTASFPMQRHRRELGRQGPWIALTALVAILVLIPIVPLQSKVFADGGAGLKELGEMRGLGSVLVNTLYLGIGATIVGLVLGTGLALSVHSLPPRLRSALSFAPVLPIIIPAVAHVVGFVFLFSPENGYANTLLRATPLFDDDASGPIKVYTPFWIIVYTGIHLSAFVYLFVYSGLQALGEDYGLAAQANGAGGLRILRTVTLPMLRPVFVYSGMIVFLLALGQFTGPLILGRREGLDVLTTRMFVLTTEYPIHFALVASLGTPLLVLAFFLMFVQRRLLGDQKRYVGRGAMSMAKAPTRPWTTAAATAFIAAFVAISAILPLLALTFVALSPYWSGKLSGEHFTTAHFVRTLSDARVQESITTSLTVTLAGVILAMPIGLLVALAVTNRDRIWRPVSIVLDVAAALPLAVPAALIGFGFLFAFSSTNTGLYGTKTALLIAYLAIMLPYAVRYQLTTLIALGPQTMESSRVSGAGPLRTFTRIVFPLSRAGMAASAAVMFVLLIHEFGVSLLLRSPESTVMSVVLYEEFSTGSYPRVAVVALVMTVITAGGVVAALAFGGTKAMERL
ncbi:ABC transporter permease subunit [Rhodococcus sp. T2V]|uniref:ABC transporter permease n=1 Tax=Rhodococcus sp. T2V TaxID=3034164 RepID=UPI0023E2BC6D|nr:ABC transporter permease subunit [Rhodococcus sp. T2V]MDF3310764.1 ABC transporter permease subunit [Rhodococcus sp. T2V]